MRRASSLFTRGARSCRQSGCLRRFCRTWKQGWVGKDGGGSQPIAQQHVHAPGYMTVGRHVNAALFLFVLLPPPAPGAFVFAIERSAGASPAADAGKAFGVERRYRHGVLTGVVFDLLAAPVG